MRLQYYIEYGFMKAVVLFVSLFPWSWNRKLAYTLLPLMYVIGNYRRLTEANIKASSLDIPKTGKPLKRFIREVFIQNIITYIEMMKLMTMKREAVMKHFRFADVNVLRKTYETGKGAIFVLGHIGNWEILGQATAYSGFPLYAVARRQNNPLTDEMLNTMRRKSGFKVIFREGNSAMEIIRALHEKAGVAMLNDQDGGLSGVTTRFMGRMCSTPQGPVVIGLKTGVPVLFVYTVRDENGDHVAYVGEPEVLTRRHPDLETDIREHLQKLVDKLEAVVAQYPTQWNWLANRWRTKRNATV